MGRGNAQTEQMLAHNIQCDTDLYSAWAGNCLIDQVHGVVDKQASWLTIGMPKNFATGGRNCIGINASCIHCRAVGPTGVTIDTGQPHWVVGDKLIQLGRSGKLLVWPQYLIPTATFNPLQLRLLSGVAGDFFSDLLSGLLAADINTQ